jgi:hypothetical protein
VIGYGFGDGFRQMDALARDTAIISSAVAGQDVAVALQLAQFAAPHPTQQGQLH